jgi:hypothetical protein
MAAQHAGFAAAVAIGQRALDTLAKATYFTPSFDHRLKADVPGASSSNPTVSLEDIFLDAPHFVLKQASQGRIGLRLNGWGSVKVGAERRDCQVELLVGLPARVLLVKGRLGILLDAMMATLDVLSVRPFAGSSFSTATQAYLDSAAFKGVIEFGLRLELSKRGALLPPFDVSFLGAVATDPSTTATLAIVDDALMIGMDIASGGVTTTGDKTLLTNFLADRDVGMWMHPSVLPIAFASMRQGLDAQVMKEGATLTSFSLNLEEGGFRVNGQANSDTGSLTFSVLASPVLDRSGDPLRDRLRIWLSEAQVSTQPAWWVVGLEVLSLGIGVAVVEFFATVVRSNIVNGIKVSPSSDVAPATIRFTLPGVPEPAITLKMVAFECHIDGVFVAMLVGAEFRHAKMVGPTDVPADEVPGLAAAPLVYRADLAFDALPDDPMLRARWTVRLPRATSALLVQDGGVAGGGAILNITGINVPLLTSSVFDVACRLYRVRGSDVDELFDQTTTLSVRDRLDRSHPYVRWRHQVLVPVVRREIDGSKTIVGTAIKTRASKLHRTAIPGRCRMASHYSQSWMQFDDEHPGPTLEYLDDLPFARADLVANRAQVCD